MRDCVSDKISFERRMPSCDVELRCPVAEKEVSVGLHDGAVVYSSWVGFCAKMPGALLPQSDAWNCYPAVERCQNRLVLRRTSAKPVVV